MAKTTAPTIETLLRQGAWGEARQQIERELQQDRDNHWLLTQLGVTYYEQERYRESLSFFLRSLEIVPDCPLTLWNVAGTLDALGKPEIAIPTYAWLLGSKKSVDDDPCWESEDWADTLKADSVYRVGNCFRHMRRWESAELCFRQYINLLLAGRNGTYSIEDAASHIKGLHGTKPQHLKKEVRDAIESTLHEAGVQSAQGGKFKLPKLSLPELLAK